MDTLSSTPESYQSYILRLWRFDRDGQSLWRASLESPLTGEHHVFASPQALLEFLAEQAPVTLISCVESTQEEQGK